MGMDVELEHCARDLETNVTDDDTTVAAIARAHLNEFPDYYSRLAVMEAEAEAYAPARAAAPPAGEEVSAGLPRARMNPPGRPASHAPCQNACSASSAERSRGVAKR